MNIYHNEDAGWAIARMQQHVSYSGWLFAMTCGALMWALMFRIIV